MKLSVFLLLNVALASKSVLATDYCNKDLCKGLGRHIACKADSNFSDLCPEDAELVEISKELQDVIVDGINEKRNFIAGGGDKKLSPACRMATIQWSNELAELAVYNVKFCTLSHGTTCRNTDAFKYVGQNLAWLGYSGPLESVKKFKYILNMWYEEVKNTTMEYIKKYPREVFEYTVGHFTLLVADRNVRVGCAASTYSYKGRDSYKAFLVTCNFATTNVIDYPIYKHCSKAAMDCTTGTNPKYSNLCSTSENYKVNEWL